MLASAVTCLRRAVRQRRHRHLPVRKRGPLQGHRGVRSQRLQRRRLHRPRLRVRLAYVHQHVRHRLQHLLDVSAAEQDADRVRSGADQVCVPGPLRARGDRQRGGARADRSRQSELWRPTLVQPSGHVPRAARHDHARGHLAAGAGGGRGPRRGRCRAERIGVADRRVQQQGCLSSHAGRGRKGGRAHRRARFRHRLRLRVRVIFAAVRARRRGSADLGGRTTN